MKNFREWFESNRMSEGGFGNGKFKNGVFESDYVIIIKHPTHYEYMYKNRKNSRKILIDGAIIYRYEGGTKTIYTYKGNETLTNYHSNTSIRDYKFNHGIDVLKPYHWDDIFGEEVDIEILSLE